ncbi:MAG: hypothetical protein Pg6A_13100 [Termitinemataceae bacterium]|nr:MAG: hypothetical protein Pg6A_13100 [Termitinemataceae bacterium]
MWKNNKYTGKNIRARRDARLYALMTALRMGLSVEQAVQLINLSPADIAAL